MSSKHEHLRLSDIIDNIDFIFEYVGERNYDSYVADRRTSDACERCRERVCEAVVKIGPERMAAIAPQIDLGRVRGLGNLMRHSYDRVDARFIFTLIQDDLPGLRAACVAALEDPNA